MPLKGLKEVKKAIAKNKRDANEGIKAVYMDGLSKIISATPADKGTARNNWFLSVGRTVSNFGRDASKSGNGSYRSLDSMPDYILNKKIYFTNNTAYIGLLEYGGYPNPVKKGSFIKRSGSYEILSIGGFSKQASKGWVRSTLISIQNKVRSL